MDRSKKHHGYCNGSIGSRYCFAVYNTEVLGEMTSSFSAQLIVRVAQTFVLTIITEKTFWALALQCMASELSTVSSIQAKIVGFTCAFCTTKLARITMFANTFSTKNCVVLDPNMSYFHLLLPLQYLFSSSTTH